MPRMTCEPQFRSGSGEPLLLLHGAYGHWSNWGKVLHLLATGHDVLAPAMGGNAGGALLPGGPVTIDSYADSVEVVLDAAGWDTAHIAGNSLGGWTAMELARRGRARSVVALSPAGGWPDEASGAQVKRFFAATRRAARLGRPLAPVGFHSPLVRRLAFKDIAEHGDRIARKDAVALLDFVRYADPRLLTVGSKVERYPDPGVPALIAWSENDRLIPAPVFSDPWRAAAPHAEFRVLPGVGHVPMHDDPQLVADTIRDWVSSALT